MNQRYGVWALDPPYLHFAHPCLGRLDHLRFGHPPNSTKLVLPPLPASAQLAGRSNWNACRPIDGGTHLPEPRDRSLLKLAPAMEGASELQYFLGAARPLPPSLVRWQSDQDMARTSTAVRLTLHRWV